MDVRSSRALTAWPLIAAAMALPAPVAAQQVAPPPITATQPVPAPAPQPAAPPPVVATAPAPAEPAPSAATAIDPRAAANAAAEQAERRATPRATRAPAVARATPAAAPAPAPVAPVIAAPAPVEETAAPTATPRAATETAAPAPAPAAPRDGSIWPWVVAAIAAIGVAAGLLLWRRRRAREDAWAETAYTTEPAHAEPVHAAPVAHAAVPAAAVAAPAMLDRATPAEPVVATVEDASVVHADAADVEALTAAAPAGDRPWLELAMRPVRAGTTDDDARVEIELTVGNAGAVDAEDVRISTFMLADADDGEIERMLIDPPVGDAVEPLRIGAGEGTRVDATLTLPRDRLASEARFRPVVIAEARYRLPNGGEGRTAASFDIGVTGDPDAPLPPITTAGTELRDDVEARLHRAAEHA